MSRFRSLAVLTIAVVVSIATSEAPPVTCGDGIVNAFEECDDGNFDDFDDCRNDCTVPVCGDGIVDGGEECDDGNGDDFDDCANDCFLN